MWWETEPLGYEGEYEYESIEEVDFGIMKSRGVGKCGDDVNSWHRGAYYQGLIVGACTEGWHVAERSQG